MRPGKHQFSIGRLIYLTIFAATLVAMFQSSVRYAFIYWAGFIIVMLAYVTWQVYRPIAGLPQKTIVEEWDIDDATKAEGDQSPGS